MRSILQSSAIRNATKSTIPVLAASVTALHIDGLLRYAEMGTALLQGKGAGSGWDLRAELRAAAQCIHRSNPILFDVGANRGEWSSGMFRLFPQAEKIILFEPQEQCIAEIEKLDLPGKVVVPAAAGDSVGSHTFFAGAPGWVAASLFHRGDTFFSGIQQHEITVSVMPLDDVIEQQGIGFVDFVKFDIEGAELLALNGARRALSRKAIGAMSLEFGSGNINSRTFFRDFWEFLTGYGFELSRVLPNGRLTRIREYYEDLEYFRGVSNYIARLPGTNAAAPTQQ